MSLCKHPLAASHRPCMREGPTPFSLLPELDCLIPSKQTAQCSMFFLLFVKPALALVLPMPFRLTGHNYQRTFATSYPSSRPPPRSAGRTPG